MQKLIVPLMGISALVATDSTNQKGKNMEKKYAWHPLLIGISRFLFETDSTVLRVAVGTSAC